MYPKDEDVLNLLGKIRESTTPDIDEERGSFKKGDKVVYNMFGSGLNNSDLVRTLGADEHASRLNHNESVAEVVESVGEEVARYSIMFEDGFVITNVCASELKDSEVNEKYRCVRCGSGKTAEIEGKIKCLKCGHVEDVAPGETLGIPPRESTTNEAEDAEQTMKPQEEPDVKAEDSHMEDLSKEDLEKPKKKPKDAEDVIKPVEDDELKIEPDKVVKPKKESVIEGIKDISDDELKKLHSNARRSLELWKADKAHAELITQSEEVLKAYEDEMKERGLFGAAMEQVDTLEDAVIKVYRKAREESQMTREQAVQKAAKSSKGKMSAPDVRNLLLARGVKDSKFSFVSRQKPLWLCNECCRTFRSNESKCTECDSENTERITQEEKGTVHFFKKPFKVVFKDGEKEKEDKVMAFDEEDAKQFVEDKNPSAEIISVEKIERAMEGRDSDLAAGQTKEPFKVTWKNKSTGKEESTTVMAFDKAHAEREAKRPSREDIKVEGPITEEPKKGSKEGDDAPFESSLKEGIRELVGEVPGIEKEEQAALYKALEDGVIPNEWPSDEQMVDELTKAGVDAAIADFDDIQDFRIVYLKHILLTKAMKPYLAATTNEKEEDWDLTFKYEHNQLWSNPLLDKKGDPVSAFRPQNVAGKKIRVFTDYQANWVEKNRAIPMRSELEEKEMRQKEIEADVESQVVIEISRSKIDSDVFNLSIVELPKGEKIEVDTDPDLDKLTKKGKELARTLNAKFAGLVSEDKVDEQTFSTIAKGIEDKANAEEIARKEKGQVVTDEEDPKKFMVIVKEE